MADYSNMKYNDEKSHSDMLRYDKMELKCKNHSYNRLDECGESGRPC